jgi:hypothetical protein
MISYRSFGRSGSPECTRRRSSRCSDNPSRVQMDEAAFFDVLDDLAAVAARVGAWEASARLRDYQRSYRAEVPRDWTTLTWWRGAVVSTTGILEVLDAGVLDAHEQYRAERMVDELWTGVAKHGVAGQAAPA